MKNSCDKYLDFFWKLSKLLAKNYPPEKFTLHLEDIFNRFLKLKNLKIYTYDKENNLIRDFGKSGIIIDDKKLSQKLLGYIETIEKSLTRSILVNSEIFSVSSVKQNKVKLKTKNNLIHMPVYCENTLAGLVEVTSTQFEITADFAKVVNIALFEIASAITNARLSRKAQKNTLFYQTIKDIAKIIESYFKLEDILPLIGESLDKFTPDHLTYIFIKEGESFNLEWPSKYNQIKIDPLIEKLKNKTLISKDKRTGVFPIFIEDKLFGAIVVDSSYMKLSHCEKNYIEQIVKQIAITIDKAGAYSEILELASTDTLTGMNNRRNLEKRLSQEVSTSLRKKTQLCSMMIDIDHFKKVNDKYGHQAGDVVLKEVSKIIQEELREYDTASRYGGEEFLILLPFTSLEEAEIVAQRVRKKVEESSFDLKKTSLTIKKSVKITISIGISKFVPSEGVEEFYKNTDKALYQAKQQGRNQVVVFN